MNKYTHLWIVFLTMMSVGIILFLIFFGQELTLAQKVFCWLIAGAYASLATILVYYRKPNTNYRKQSHNN
jgi:hypothetical protein